MGFYTPDKDTQAMESDAEKAGLPTVLIIGDSISQGYTQRVRKLLASRWDVQRPKANCGNTFFGLEKVEEWLGGRCWDIIHFNWGLHDLCYRHPDSEVYGNRDKVKGAQTMSPGQYAENLGKLVCRLKESGALLIWANTTVIPPGEAGRYEGDDVRYNDVAAKIMEKHDIPTNDLYSLTSSFGPERFMQACDVHFNDEGYDIIAKQVAECIERLGYTSGK